MEGSGSGCPSRASCTTHCCSTFKFTPQCLTQPQEFRTAFSEPVIAPEVSCYEAASYDKGASKLRRTKILRVKVGDATLCYLAMQLVLRSSQAQDSNISDQVAILTLAWAAVLVAFRWAFSSIVQADHELHA